MRAINHALTGAIIGLSIDSPVLAIPASFVSHFICDAIPHHGFGGNDESIRSKKFLVSLVIDFCLCVLLVCLLALMRPERWVLGAICAFVATAPDFAWLPGYVRVKQGGRYKTGKQHLLFSLAARLQWFEKPIGGLVELAWFAGASVLLSVYL